MKTARISANGDESRLLDTNTWVLVTNNDAFLQAHPSQPEYSTDDDLHVRLWTDQYSNLFQILEAR